MAWNTHWLRRKAERRARGPLARRRCLLEHLETRRVLAAPVANASSLSVTEDLAKAFTLTGSDADNDPLTYAVTSAPLHGVLSGSAPNLTYTPVGNYAGSDSFQFKVNDGTTDSAPATVTITVNNVNDPPVVTQNDSSPVNYIRDAAGVHILRGALDPFLLATLADEDSADFSGGVVQVQTTAGAHTNDRVVVSGRFSISGSDLLYKTTKIGVVTSNGAGGTALTVNLNASATPTLVAELANSIRFFTINGKTGSRTITLSISDGDGGASNTVTRTLIVWPSTFTVAYDGNPAVKFPAKGFDFVAPLDLSGVDGVGLEAYNPGPEPVRLGVSFETGSPATAHLSMQTIQPRSYARLGASFKTSLDIHGLPFTESDVKGMNSFTTAADLANITRISFFLDLPQVAVNVQVSNLRIIRHIPLDTPLIDKYGQYTRRDWSGKADNDAELTQLIQADIAERQATPPEPNRDAYGGITNSGVNFGGAVPAGGTGHFTTAQDTSGRWWLVTPLGNPFYAVGVNAPAPSSGSPVSGRSQLFEPVDPLSPTGVYDYYQANLQRYNAVEGAGATWQKRTIDRLRDWGFNSVGNWPDETLTVDVPGAPRFPYMRTVQFQRLRLMPPVLPEGGPQPPTQNLPGTDYPVPVFYTNGGVNAFPDVFSESFAEYVLQDTVTSVSGTIPGFFGTPEVARTSADPYAIGFFVDNEIRWAGGEREDRKALPRAGLNSVGSLVRTRFLQELAQKYASADALMNAWEVSFSPSLANPAATAVTAIGNAQIVFPTFLNSTAQVDLEDLLGVYADQYYKTVRDGFKAHMPNKLYLGSRLYEGEASPGVMAALGQYADAISINLYRRPEDIAAMDWSAFAALNKPLLIGEFGHVATDQGHFTGFHRNRDVATQKDRGALYEQYMDLIADNPLFVGASVFSYSDEVATGRELDFENLNVGLVDILDLPHEDYVHRVAQWNRAKYESRLGVDPANTAPVLNPALTPPLTSILEDDAVNWGTPVSTLLAGVTDVDPIAERGVAVTSLGDTDKGTWQYTLDGGLSWFDFGAISPAAARLLPDSDGFSRIRFRPNANFVGEVSLTFHAWDQSQGNQGLTFNVAATGGATAFSADPVTVTLAVTAVSDAPQLNTTITPELSPVGQGNANPYGTSVASLQAGISDPDAGAQKGIAVISLTGAVSGTWQYTLNDGVAWNDFGAVGIDAAVLLPANGEQSRIRFRPLASFSGNVQLGYHAWDQTLGSAGIRVDISNADELGGASAFSAERRTSNVRINNAPQLNTAVIPVPPSSKEDNFTPYGFGVWNLMGGITDNTNALRGIAVTALGGEANGKWQYTLNSGTTWVDFGAVTAAAARLLPSNGEISRLRFVPNANFNGPVAVAYGAWDQTQGVVGGTFDLSVANATGGFTAFSANERTGTLTISPVNDAPALTYANSSLPSIAEDTPVANDAGTLVSSLIGSVTDIDGGGAKGIAVYSLGGKTTGSWEYSLDGGTTWTAIGDPTDSAALLLADTNRVRYVPNANFNGTVNIYFRAWDRSNNLAPGSITTTVGKLGGINAYSTNNDVGKLTVTPVNDAPTLFISGSINYLRDAAAVILSSTAGLDDVDSTLMQKVTVRISDGAHASNRLLIGGAFALEGSNVKSGAQIIGAINANGGVGTTNLVITFTTPVSKTVARDVIRGISFKTVSGTGGTRKILFSVTDGQGAVSAEAFKTVNVLQNASPLLTYSNPALTAVAEDTPGASNAGTLVSSLIANVTDADGPGRGIAVYSLGGKTTGSWEYSLDGGTTWTAIGDPTDSAALLLADTNRARYVPNANFNGTVNIYFRAWDRSNNLAPGSITTTVGKLGGINAYSTNNDVGKLTVTPVNDAPTLFISGSINYLRDAAAVILSSTAGLDDVDSTLMQKVTVRISDGAHASNRLLIGGAFTLEGSNVKSGAQIIGAINANGGVGTTNLVITFTTPVSKTVARDVIRGISFKTVSGTGGARKILFSVTDGQGAVSAEAFKTVNVLQNASPLLTYSNPALTAVAEDTPGASNAGTLVSSLIANVTDADGPGRGIAVYSLGGKTTGSWEYSLDGGTTWTAIGDPTDSAALLLADTNRVRYVPNANFNGTVNIYFRAWDRSNNLAPGSITTTVGKLGGINAYSTNNDVGKLTVTPVNDAPTLLIAGSTGYVHDAAAVVIAPTAGLDDIDSNIKRITVRISDGANASNRLLIGGLFTLSGSNIMQGAQVIGTLNANGGVGTTNLVITFTTPVSKTVARDVIRGISFKTVGGAAGDRKVLFSATDAAGATSAEVFKTVKVT